MSQSSVLEELEQALHYRFRKGNLLFQSLVHRSYVHENPHLRQADNETLEFLGDAVLGLAVSHLLLDRFPQCREGELSRFRSSIVNEKELAKVATDLDLGRCLLLGKGEELTGGRNKPSLLADTLEAVLAAVYLDGGMDEAIRVVSVLFHEYFNAGDANLSLRTLDKDYKTQLQEITQARHRMTPVYQLKAEEGPDHNKTFSMSVVLGERVLAHGSGKSKKEAQQEAARRALDLLQSESDFPGAGSESPGVQE
ncbi:MAG TPA: ribonuclease III [Syntrophobacteraceae bacterium]|nr:ribonuclease III [Syntrophobacteraceae bacterium]